MEYTIKKICDFDSIKIGEVLNRDNKETEKVIFKQPSTQGMLINRDGDALVVFSPYMVVLEDESGNEIKYLKHKQGMQLAKIDSYCLYLDDNASKDMPVESIAGILRGKGQNYRVPSVLFNVIADWWKCRED